MGLSKYQSVPLNCIRLQALVEAVYNGVQALLYSAIVFTMVGFDHNIGTLSCLRLTVPARARNKASACGH